MNIYFFRAIASSKFCNFEFFSLRKLFIEKRNRVVQFFYGEDSDISQLMKLKLCVSWPKIPNHFMFSSLPTAISNAVPSIVVFIGPMCLIQLEFCRPENQATAPWPSCQHPLYFCINFGLLRKSARLEFRNL